MNANLLMHVREHPSGRVIVTAVDFGISVDADDPQTAMRMALRRATERLRSRSGSMRAMLAAPVVAGLDRVTVEVTKRKRPKPVSITVGLVDEFLVAELRHGDS
jgi:hypothetical protein